MIKAEFKAAHTAGKLTYYSQMVLLELEFEQKGPTLIHIDNLPALNMINNNTAPTQRTLHCGRYSFLSTSRLERGVNVTMQTCKENSKSI